jgi:hypothetical protein
MFCCSSATRDPGLFGNQEKWKKLEITETPCMHSISVIINNYKYINKTLPPPGNYISTHSTLLITQQ